jgi:hypothetical protein
MSFQDWQKNGWLRPHKTSRQEIAGLLAVVERDFATSSDPKLDGDWRFAIAYNAALQCAALALKAAGYEVPKAGGAHHHTIESLRLTIGDDGTIVDPLQAFRTKRGGGIYETTGVASDTEIEELRALAMGLRDRVLAWLKQAHADLLPQQPSSASKSGRRNGGASKTSNHGHPRSPKGE